MDAELDEKVIYQVVLIAKTELREIRDSNYAVFSKTKYANCGALADSLARSSQIRCPGFLAEEYEITNADHVFNIFDRNPYS